MRETTIHLSDAAADADEHVDRVKDAYNDLMDHVDETYETVEVAPDVVMERREQYKQEWERARGLARVVEETLEDWDGPTKDEDGRWRGDDVTIRMLSGGQLAEVQDKVSASASAMEKELGVLPRDVSGSRALEVLDECVVDTPGGAPPPDEWPHHLMMWLYQKVNALNTAGDTDFSASDSEFEAAMGRD